MLTVKSKWYIQDVYFTIPSSFKKKGLLKKKKKKSATGAAAVENTLAVPQKLDTEPPCDPPIPLLRVHPKELKAEPKPVFAHACSQQHYSEQPKHGNLTINREKEKQNVLYTHNSAFTRDANIMPRRGRAQRVKYAESTSRAL